MKMKIWWFANFYWFSLLIYLNANCKNKLNTYHNIW